MKSPTARSIPPRMGIIPLSSVSTLYTHYLYFVASKYQISRHTIAVLVFKSPLFNLITAPKCKNVMLAIQICQREARKYFK